jgi:hypothetical protein
VNSVLQNTFTPGTGPIGFYLMPTPTLQTVFGVTRIHTDPLLNPSAEDMAGAFPIIGVTDAFLLGFAAVVPGGPGDVIPLGYAAVLNLQVPEPGTLALIIVGALGTFIRRRRGNTLSGLAS